MSAMFDGMTPKDLVMWTRPQATGAVVGAIGVWLFLLGYMEYTLLTLVCRVFQLGACAWFVASKLNYAPQVTRTDLQDALTKGLNAVEPHIVNALGLLVDIISWQNATFTMQVLVGSIMVSWVGSFFSDLTLLFLVTVGVFAGPITYTQNKEVIDAQLKQLEPMVKDLLAKVPMLQAGSTDHKNKTD